MNNRRTVRLQCVGVTPCHMNKITDDEIMALVEGWPTPDVSLAERLEEKIYRGPAGDIGLPVGVLTQQFKEALYRSGVASKEMAEQIASSEYLRPTDQFLRFTNITEVGKKYWRAYELRGRPLSSDTQMTWQHPEFPEWTFEIEFEYDSSRLKSADIRKLMTMIGYTGIGADKRLGFGKFAVASFEEG